MGRAPVAKRPPLKPMFSLAPVQFRDSGIPGAGRGVFARRAFSPGEVVVAYAPRQRVVAADAPEAEAAAQSRLTLLSGERVIIPDTTVPGGWLCNHSCDPNATLYSGGGGRIECARPIRPGDEVTIFYGWVSQNEPGRDPCRCGAARCRGFINFDLCDADLAEVEIRGGKVELAPGLERRLAAYGAFLQAIGQEQVNEVIAKTLVRMKLRANPQPR